MRSRTPQNGTGAGKAPWPNRQAPGKGANTGSPKSSKLPLKPRPPTSPNMAKAPRTKAPRHTIRGGGTRKG